MTTFKQGMQLYDSQYIVEKQIGSGGEGSIYIVYPKDNPNNKLAAKVYTKPKEVTPEYWKKRSQEVLTLVRISQKPNPNLAKTYDVFVTPDDEIVTIMDLIDGVTLDTYLNKQGCLIPKVALNIFLKMLNGVKQLHHYKHKIIHRDLKPANIMVSNDLSKVIIVDFGISTVVDDENKVLTNELAIWGSGSYVLPDLLDVYFPKNKDKPKNISVQSDFYSLGVILSNDFRQFTIWTNL